MQDTAWQSIVEKKCYIPGGGSVRFASTETSALQENSSKELQIVSGQYQRASSEADALLIPTLLCSMGLCLWAHMMPCHITVGFWILQALIGTQENEFSSNDLSGICSLGKVTTPPITCKERFSSFCNQRDASPQWTHFLSNSTIYYLIALIYSDRIPALFSLHFTFDDLSLWILSYQGIWDEFDHCKLEPNVIHCQFSVLYQTILNNWRKKNWFELSPKCPTVWELHYTDSIQYCSQQMSRCIVISCFQDVMYPSGGLMPCLLRLELYSLHITVHSLMFYPPGLSSKEKPVETFIINTLSGGFPHDPFLLSSHLSHALF